MLYLLIKVIYFVIPVLIAFPALYLLVEIYFVNAFINTYSTSTNPQALENFEIVGRAISATGIALSVMLARSSKFFVREGWDFSFRTAWWTSIKTFFVSFFVGFVGIIALTYALNWLVDSPATRFCAWQGHYIKDKVQNGIYSPLESWNSETNYMNINQHQVALSILPYSYCANESLRKEALADTAFTAIIFKEFIEYAFSESEQLQKYKRFVNGKTQIESRIDDFYKAYRYVITNSESRGDRAIRKVWKEVAGHHFEKEIMQAFAFVSKSDKARGGNRSKSEFTYLFKSRLAIEISGIDFKPGDWRKQADNLFGPQFVRQNLQYFYTTPEVDQKFFDSSKNTKKPYPKDYYDKKLADYVLQKFIFDTGSGSLDEKLDKDMHETVEAMIMPVIILAISAFSMLLLAVNVVLTFIRLMIYHNSAVSWFVDLVGSSRIAVIIFSTLTTLGLAYIVFVIPWLFVILVSVVILAFLLLVLNALINYLYNSSSGLRIPRLLNDDADESRVVQALTHPSVYLIIILFLGSYLPPSPSERSLLYSNNENIVSSMIKIGARLQFYAFPVTVSYFKAMNINPWLPHTINEEKLQQHANALFESNRAKRLLTPVHDSVAWHALVLANHKALSKDNIITIKKMFRFYENKDAYKGQAQYSDFFLKNNIKSFD